MFGLQAAAADDGGVMGPASTETGAGTETAHGSGYRDGPRERVQRRERVQVVMQNFCKSPISRKPNFGHRTPAEHQNWKNKFRKQKRKADELAAHPLLPKKRRRKTKISAPRAKNLMSK